MANIDLSGEYHADVNALIKRVEYLQTENERLREQYESTPERALKAVMSKHSITLEITTTMRPQGSRNLLAPEAELEIIAGGYLIKCIDIDNCKALTAQDIATDE